nr:acyl carrier protein [Kaistia sp. 32K]
MIASFFAVGDVLATDITPDKNLVDDLGADSLDLIEIVMEVEGEFDIEISDAAAEQVRTVQQAIDLVSRLVGQ